MVEPVQLFQSARTILCVCPCCGKLVRLSDLSLRYEGVAPQTWLDKHEKRVTRLEGQETLFAEQEAIIRETAHKKGRKKANKAMSKVVRSALPGCTYHPKDIKALLHPVDYVVFCGMTDEDKVDDVVLLSKETNERNLQSIRKSIEKAIDNGNYDWRVARVSEKGEVTIE